MLKVFAPIKLNLMLHVIRKRFDGYHDIQSLITFLNYGDLISINPSDAFRFLLQGQFAESLLDEDNLVIKAVRWAVDLFSQSIDSLSIRLDKLIPISSGIGGGSSDAAATIYGLIRHWNIKLTDHEINELIIKSGCLGADVPVCLAHQFYNNLYFFIDGSGKEGATSLQYEKKFHYVLVNPLKAISTSEVFKKNKIFVEPIKLEQVDINFIVKSCNTFTDTVVEMVSEIGTILKVLTQQDGAICARLSGSGATCFAIFDNEECSKKAEQNLKTVFPDYWIIRC